jgi:phosphoribosylformylglycinamidine synthase subunit PurS
VKTKEVGRQTSTFMSEVLGFGSWPLGLGLWVLGFWALGLRSVIYNDCFMTAYVYVSLKKSVLDPQGKTIQGALKKMGYKGLESVRQGKYFELTLDGGLSREEAQAEVERIAREVLTNPVIEEFRFSLAE